MLVNIHEAKTHLSRLVKRLAAGEEIVIAKAGRPVAKLVPYQEEGGPRSPGAWAGRLKIGPDLDELPFEAATAFGGEAG